SHPTEQYDEERSVDLNGHALRPGAFSRGPSNEEIKTQLDKGRGFESCCRLDCSGDRRCGRLSIMSQLPNHPRRPKAIDNLGTILLIISVLLGSVNVFGNQNAWWAHPLAYLLSGVVVGLAVANWIARKDGAAPQEEHFQRQPSLIKTLLFWVAILA